MRLTTSEEVESYFSGETSLSFATIVLGIFDSNTQEGKLSLEETPDGPDRGGDPKILEMIILAVQRVSYSSPAQQPCCAGLP